jgi:hypothetical protein
MKETRMMSLRIRGVEYFHSTAEDRPGQAYELLAKLASADVNLLAFTAIPVGAAHTQLTLFPENTERLIVAAEKLGLTLIGPHRAFLIQGDDRLGALAEIHRRLYDARINVFVSSGVTDGQGGYGYVMYVRPEDYNSAAHVLDAG